MKVLSDNDLAFAKEVYRCFQCKNFGSYHDLYLKLDTILTKDVFNNFKETCYENNKLDTVYYISAPKLELLTHQEHYEIYEKGISNGIYNVFHKHTIANHFYVYDEKIRRIIKLSKEKVEEKVICNSKKYTSYILYLDCNNLYGWATFINCRIFKLTSIKEKKENILKK